MRVFAPTGEAVSLSYVRVDGMVDCGTARNVVGRNGIYGKWSEIVYMGGMAEMERTRVRWNGGNLYTAHIAFEWDKLDGMGWVCLR